MGTEDRAEQRLGSSNNLPLNAIWQGCVRQQSTLALHQARNGMLTVK